MNKKKHLRCILKTVERCNLNCKYCYFFNRSDRSYKNHPPFISKEVIIKLASFLLDAIRDLNLSSISIGFHGGEPMLQKKVDFNWVCSYLTDQLSRFVTLNYNIQSNGLLIDEEWIELFVRHKVTIGISIDGTKEINDSNRIDHFGRGSYDRLREKILFIMNHPKINNNLISISALSVINPEYDSKITYNHLVEELNFRNIDFLLPDNHHEDLPSLKPNQYGQCMIDIFNLWTAKQNPEIKVRFCTNVLRQFFGKNSSLYGSGKQNDSLLPFITISSGGNLTVLDELRNTAPLITYEQEKYNLDNIKLKDLFEKPAFSLIKEAETLPSSCNDCKWRNICHGGAILNRYSKTNEFNNKSVYCEGLKMFYSNVEEYLITNNIQFRSDLI